MNKELKRIEVEGTNIILLSYSPERYGIKEVLASVEHLQNRVGEGKQVITLPKDVSLHAFDFQEFLDYLGKRFDVDIMYRKRK